MGDMAEPWRSMRHERQIKVAKGKRLSMQYHDEKARDEGVAFKYDCQSDFDRWTAEKLNKLGIEFERKGHASFQITVNGRKGMYYDGKKGEKIHWNDGEKVNLSYSNSLEEYLAQTNLSKGNDDES